MSEFGKPKTFLADGANGKPPVLYHGISKVELDEFTAIQWWWVLSNWIRHHYYEEERRTH